MGITAAFSDMTTAGLDTGAACLDVTIPPPPFFPCAGCSFIYLLFGKRRMLPVALTWQRMMNREFFVTTIDVAMGYLFTWKSSQVRWAMSWLHFTASYYGSCVAK